jgi:uncharacterized damage-inducible protein DinB
MSSDATPVDSELAALRRCFRYITAARSIYLEFFSRLPPEALQRDSGASYPSILDIFAHALKAHQDWIQYAYRHGTRTRSKAAEWTLPEVQQLALDVQQLLDEFLTSLTGNELRAEFTFRWNPSDESSQVTYTTRDMLWHLVEEELQHRGEINAILWQMDIEPPIHDWLDWTAMGSADD